MVSLKSFAKVIMSPLAFLALIVAPMPFRGSNICILALFGATREQYNQSFPVHAKKDPITGTEINPKLIDADATTFHVSEVTLLHPMDYCRRHLDRSGHIQTIKPFDRAAQVAQARPSRRADSAP